jgi:hypothetical protein
MAPGEMKSYLEVDENTGSEIRHFVGRRPFTDEPQYGNRPCRRVVSFSRPIQTIVQYGDKGLVP